MYIIKERILLHTYRIYIIKILKLENLHLFLFIYYFFLYIQKNIYFFNIYNFIVFNFVFCFLYIIGVIDERKAPS